MNYWTFAWRFYARNNWSLNACRTVLRRVQKVLERLHGGFASCTKRLWTFAWSFCIMNKRALNVCMELLHVCKKALKFVQGDFARIQKGIEVSSRGFARVQKGIEQCKNGLVHGTIWPWSYFKSFLRSVQFRLEVTSGRFAHFVTITEYTSQIICLFTILLHRSDHFPNTLYKVVMLFLIQFTNTTGAWSYNTNTYISPSLSVTRCGIKVCLTIAWMR